METFVFLKPPKFHIIPIPIFSKHWVVLTFSRFKPPSVEFSDHSPTKFLCIFCSLTKRNKTFSVFLSPPHNRRSARFKELYWSFNSLRSLAVWDLNRIQNQGAFCRNGFEDLRHFPYFSGTSNDILERILWNLDDSKWKLPVNNRNFFHTEDYACESITRKANVLCLQ